MKMQTIEVLKNLNRFRNLYQNFRCKHFTSSYREEQKRPKRKVREDTELITLIDSTDKVLGIKSKTDSETLARKHHMLLEKVAVHRFGNTYPVYKLVSGAEIVKRDESKKATSTTRDVKKISLSGRITDHDLDVKLKMMKRLLGKNCEIRIAVTGNSDETNAMEAVYKKISEHFGTEARILDKRVQGSALRFIMIPPKVVKEQEKNQPNKILDLSVEQEATRE